MFVKIKKIKKFVSGADLPKHPKKHHKPFRIHHVSLFFSGIILFIVSALGIGYIWGKSAATNEVFLPPTSQNKPTSSLKEVKSSLGYQFVYDSTVFSVEGRAQDSGSELPEDSLAAAKKLSEVIVRPRASYVSNSEGLSEFYINTRENKQDYEKFKAAGDYSSDAQALEAYYAPKDDEYFSHEKISSSSSNIGGKKFQEVVYKQLPKFGSKLKPIYKIMWVGINQGRPLQFQLSGLLEPEEVPVIYNQIFKSLKFGVVSAGASLEPLVFSIFKADDDSRANESFDINAISPAVVKVYHFICGRLVLEGVSYGDGLCGSSVGSGFLISSDGVVATNGHVISKEAADILVGEFLNNPALLAQFADSQGLTPAQTANNSVVASLLAKLYDFPESQLRLENKTEAILIALGDKPVVIKNEENLRNLKVIADDDFIKQAEIIGIDYEPKDLLVIEQGEDSGFSASDVALLKIDVNQAPFITLANSSSLQQNDPISLIGFPSDAENNLISDTSLAPTVTNGTINSIRMAKGSDSKLFQTDADASQGSSGGPAINEDGQAFGLLTYRFKDNNQANAAKSYIRDVEDLKNLIEANNVTLNTSSQSQDHWQDGLKLFSQSRYSEALGEFRIVYENYPVHRLVNTYAAQAQQAIKEGKDIKSTNYSLLGLVYGAIAGIVGVVIGAALIAHHHKHHKVYRQEYIER